MRKVLSLSVVVILLLSGCVSNGEKAAAWQRQVDKIEIMWSNWGATYGDYLIDFTERQFYQYSIQNYLDHPQQRDPTAENYGFQIVTPLDNAKIDKFFVAAIQTGLFQLKDSVTEGITDVTSIVIMIYLQDGSVIERYCYGDLPTSWKTADQVFLELTGKSLL